MIESADIAGVMRDAMDAVAVRPGYGGHPRVAIYGLARSAHGAGRSGDLRRAQRRQLAAAARRRRAARARDPARSGRAGTEFRIGLAAHDLAGAHGRARGGAEPGALRDADGPTLPSRFLLRVEALLGDDLDKEHRERTIPALLPLLDRDAPARPPYPRPAPDPAPDLREVPIKVTALDRLLGDPYQFYAQAILDLQKMQPLAADPFSDPALRGTLVHDILDKWHRAREAEPGCDCALCRCALRRRAVHPLFRALWQPRLIAALERFEEWIDAAAAEGRTVLASEIFG
jgi:ATP-dependent helicase/nuclease subunit B